MYFMYFHETFHFRDLFTFPNNNDIKLPILVTDEVRSGVSSRREWLSIGSGQVRYQNGDV